MRAAPAELELTAILDPGETVLWTGPAAFPPASHSIPLLLCVGLVVLVYHATRSVTPAFECTGSVSCTVFYWLLPVLLFMFSLQLLFDVLERKFVWSGRARVRIVLTNRRLIRFADWPWSRVRFAYYGVNPPHLVSPGILRHGRYVTFALSPKDAQVVMDLIKMQRATI